MSNGLVENDDRGRVRDESDIVAVVGEHLTLKPKGREYVGLCPFHDDRNPSMCVIPAKQIFHCFVCGAGGDVFTFVQKYHSMGFRESLEYLAQRANIELTKFSSKDGGGSGSSDQNGVGRREVMGANEIAQGFFQAILNHPEHGEKARGVITKRGISDEMVARFGIGASPDRWDGLMMMAQKRGMSVEALLQAGVVKSRESGGEYDAFRKRLMFPIRDQIGRVVAFGGRKIDEEDEPKYLNSPETRVFHKSNTLYGLDLAGRAIKRERTAVIVEGYTDVIACHQAGIENVVATLGTAMTSGHATMLRRLCDTVVLLFDGDVAGVKAADRAIEVLFSETIDIRIAALAGYTDAKDPDELLKLEGGAEIFAKVIEGSTDLMQWRFDRLRKELEGAGPGRIAQRIEEELARLSDLGLSRLAPVRKRLMIRQIAQAAGVSESEVTQAVPVGRNSGMIGRSGPSFVGDGQDEGGSSGGAWKPDGREMLVGCLLYDPNLWLEMSEGDREYTSTTKFGSELSRYVADAMQMSAENGTGTGLHAVLDELAAMAGDVVDEGESGRLIEAQQRATMLSQIVGRDTEGVDGRVSRLFRECVGWVAIQDARNQSSRNSQDVGFMGDEFNSVEPSEGEGGTMSGEEGDGEAARLAAFIEQQRGMRKKYGRSGTNRLSGD